ncbi:hypothetical protein SAY87_012238 [Trapa incisa]|uniref:BTB domain-containing protein n=1 Tax=Trapa incisa TaxID=236973 RepID=A0AAN7JC03_9MYRT|nr:hypothetical protein SAY87_012238 [Trapa incisa]
MEAKKIDLYTVRLIDSSKRVRLLGMHRLTERGGELLLALEMGVSRSQHRISLTLLRCGQNSRIFMINNEGHTIEVEIHDGPYNVIKNWNYAGLVDAIHNDEGKCWTKKPFACNSPNRHFSISPVTFPVDIKRWQSLSSTLGDVTRRLQGTPNLRPQLGAQNQHLQHGGEAFPAPTGPPEVQLHHIKIDPEQRAAACPIAAFAGRDIAVIEPCLKSIDFVETLAAAYRHVESCPPFEKSGAYLKQCTFFMGFPDPKMFRRSLRSARQHAVDAHTKVVLSSWLRFERREDELIGTSSMDCCGRNIECPRANLVAGYNPEMAYASCMCSRPPMEDDEEYDVTMGNAEFSTSEEYDIHNDMSFCIGDEEVRCTRFKIAALSRPFKAMLCGDFRESRREKINFSHNGVSVNAMKAAEILSRTRRLAAFDPSTVLELLSFANRFCCVEMKSACDSYLAALVATLEDAMILIEYGLEETAYLLVAACLQVILRELPWSMQSPNVMRFFCSPEAREKLAAAGHSSFTLYYLLSHILMENDVRSNMTVMLLERLMECAEDPWQKQLAYHQLGVVMMEREEYKDAQHWFEAAVEAGHLYSLTGVARAKYKRGHKYSAFKLMNSLISDHPPPAAGWTYQERSVYCVGHEKMADLEAATSLDPTLLYPYKYRSVMMLEEGNIGAAISEINKIVGFMASPDCLELRAWFAIALEDYDAALRDIRAMLSLEPNYKMFHRRLHGDQLLEPHAQQWSQPDCWMQLYERWSSVDDIGSLAVVHHMVEKDPGKSLLRFRQSLLLLRLNCQKTAMHCLRLARNYSDFEHERLVYEGWILYDNRHCDEALAKAEESISIRRSFEAYFLKAYILSDSTSDSDLDTSASCVIQLLEEALRCPSDGLRKGQALNNLGSIYVDSEKLDKAADCYTNALNI